MKSRTKAFKRFALGLIATALLVSSGMLYGTPVFDPGAQPYGSLSPLAVSSFNFSNGNARAFQSWFDPSFFSGDLSSYPISSGGVPMVASPVWSASAQLKLQNFNTGRRVVTRNTSGAGVAFRWTTSPNVATTLSQAQLDSMGTATTGPVILDFVRGDQSAEKPFTVTAGDGTVTTLSGSASGTLRARAAVFGDVIHGKMLHVGPPATFYAFDNYAAFQTANATRAERIYVGANDGMLHVLDAATGNEVYAYIPSMLIGNLNKLAVDPYVHTYFADGGLAAGDANLGTTAVPDWRTMLVGGLGAGGKGLFGLDITSATAADENAARTKIKWEITNASSGFADLGHTYGDPVIVKLNTGAWAAIVGNGYNNTNTGHAVLYVINLSDGSLIKALDTGSGTVASPNGLSAPSTIDTNGDGKADVVYAGDIDGNLWKFNIGGATAASWTAPTVPLYASGLSIVGAPDVALHPVSGYLVNFATGRMFTEADAADASVRNYAYGIWDGAPAANTALLSQTLSEEMYGTATRVRVTTGLAINWTDASDPATKPLHKGWRAALPAGERALTRGFVREGRYHFTSTNPVVAQTPGPNGENWLIEIDYQTGGIARLVFDLNGDAYLSDADRIVDADGVAIQTNAGIPVGIYLGSGLFSGPLLGDINARLSTTLFNDNGYVGPEQTPTTLPPAGERGVFGGHFDLDIYFGSTDNHLHEYDDTYNVTGVNMLAASSAAHWLSTAITSTATQFKILMANQRLSPAVTFTFGGNPYIKVKDFQTTAGLDVTALPTYTLGTTNPIGTLALNMPTNAFTAKDWGTGEVRVGLMPTQTGCVRGGDAGALGEIRNGALTVLIIKATTPASAVQLNVASDPTKGYRLKSDATSQSYKLAEYTIFWHHPNKKCFTDGGWTQSPPPDTSASDPSKYKTPTAGSSDPGLGQARPAPPTAVSTTVTFTPSASYNGKSDKSGTRLTVILYSDGSKQTTKETINAKGGVVKGSTTVTTTPPTAGTGTGTGTAGGGATVTTVTPRSNIITGYQESRRQGKVGRVSWRELFRQ